MTIETARRASLEFVCVFGQDGVTRQPPTLDGGSTRRSMLDSLPTSVGALSRTTASATQREDILSSIVGVSTKLLRATQEQEWWADQVVHVLEGKRALDAAMPMSDAR